MTAMPTHADALPRLPVGDVSAHSVDAAGDFVSGNARILQARPLAFFHNCIAVANAAGFDFDTDLVAARLGDISFDEFKIAARLADLHSFHARHSSPHEVQSLNRYQDVDNKLRMTAEDETTQCSNDDGWVCPGVNE